MTDSTLTLHFTKRFGAADRIMSLLRRRGFPISGITLERTHQDEVGRMTVAVQNAAAVEQVSRHLRKLPDVLEVFAATDEDSVRREYTLARVRCTPQQRAEVVALLSAFEARVVSITAEQVVLEATGSGAKLDALFAELTPYGIEESARTSPVALRRVSPNGSGQSAQTEEETA